MSGETWGLWASFVEEDAPLDACYMAWEVEGCAIADDDDEAGPLSELIAAMVAK